MNNTKIIEFASLHFYQPFSFLNKFLLKIPKSYINVVISIEVNQISGIIPFSKDISILMLKNGDRFYIFGTHRSLNNRWIHGINLKLNIFEDILLRPSILIYHRVSEIRSDPSFLDYIQIKNFILALKPELLENESVIENIKY